MNILMVSQQYSALKNLTSNNNRKVMYNLVMHVYILLTYVGVVHIL